MSASILPDAALAGGPDPDPAEGGAHRLLAGLDRSVVLVGLMGAGKTSVGRRLAGRLGWRFADADAEIESAAGLTIPDIFELHGEAAFRDCERRVIARLLHEPPMVLATGGGAFMDAGTRALIGERAVSLWLRAELDELVRRVARRSNRPLLRQGDPAEVLARLDAVRSPIYALSDVAVWSSAGSAEVTVDRAVAGLAAFLDRRTP